MAGKAGGLLVIRGGLADQSSYWQDFFSPEREYFIGLIELHFGLLNKTGQGRTLKQLQKGKFEVPGANNRIACHY